VLTFSSLCSLFSELERKEQVEQKNVWATLAAENFTRENDEK
jgi:hypothetical protein